MSRSRHTLRCSAWWGAFARMFHLDNRELRRRTRQRRERDNRTLMSEDIANTTHEEHDE